MENNDNAGNILTSETGNTLGKDMGRILNDKINDINKNNVNEKENNNLVTDLIESQKNDKKFYKTIIVILLAIIFVQGLYHDYKWSQFDTVVVDSGDGGNASYIGNDGDVNNYGEGGSPQEKTAE